MCVCKLYYMYIFEQFQCTTEAVVVGVRIILKYCELSGTMTSFIYTGSVTATSPLKQDGTGFNHTIDESCWTPLNFSFSHCKDHEKVTDQSICIHDYFSLLIIINKLIPGQMIIRLTLFQNIG